MTPKRILITGADSRYFLSLLTLIRSLKLSANLEYPLYIFDLGLKHWEINFLKGLIPENYFILPIPKDNIFEGWNAPESRDNYAWKARVIQEIASSETHYLWIDSGALISSSLESVFEKISDSGSFIVRNFSHKNLDWTSDECKSKMNVSKEELESYQAMGTFFGVALDDAKAREFHNEWVAWCRVEGVIKGNRESHRHDQTVLSILAKRFDLQLLEPEINMKIGRYYSDVEQARNQNIPFVSHRNWIYIGNSQSHGIKSFEPLLMYFLLLPRHLHRWKLHLNYWLRWTPLGSIYVWIRNSFKGSSESLT